MTDSQVYSFNKSGVQAPREAESLQGDLEGGLCPKAHHMRDLYQLTPSVPFLDLAVDQARRYLPSMGLPPSMPHLEPLSKLSCQRIKVEIEPVTGEKGDAARGEDLSQSVYHRMRRQLRAGTHMQDREDFREGVDG